MWMTPGEIRKDYRQAKYKGEQIKILAQINSCSVKTIKQIVNGQDSGGKVEKPKYGQINYNTVRSLYDRGMNDQQIADEIGLSSKTSIYKWRKSNNLVSRFTKRTARSDKVVWE